jgi:superfamily II DNA helicase RecQ
MYVQQIGRAGRRGEGSLYLTMFDEEHLNKAIERAMRQFDDKERHKELVSEAKEVCRVIKVQFSGRGSDQVRKDGMHMVLTTCC